MTDIGATTDSKRLQRKDRPQEEGHIRFERKIGHSDVLSIVAPLSQCKKLAVHGLHWLLASIPLGGGITKVTTLSIWGFYAFKVPLHVKQKQLCVAI